MSPQFSIASELLSPKDRNWISGSAACRMIDDESIQLTRFEHIIIFDYIADVSSAPFI